MRQKVMVPTYGSSMILKASPANGSLSSGLRTTSLPFGSMPLIGGTSSGDGRKSTTASSSGCTPLYLKAEPHSTGKNAPVTTALRIKRLSVVSSGSLPSSQDVVASSSTSPAATTNSPRYS